MQNFCVSRHEAVRVSVQHRFAVYCSGWCTLGGGGGARFLLAVPMDVGSGAKRYPKTDTASHNAGVSAD